MFVDIAEEHWGRSDSDHYEPPLRPKRLSPLERAQLQAQTAALDAKAAARERNAHAIEQETRAFQAQELARRTAAESKLRERAQAQKLRHTALVDAWRREHPWQAAVKDTSARIVRWTTIGVVTFSLVLVGLGFMMQLLRQSASGPALQASGRVDESYCRTHPNTRYAKRMCPQPEETLSP